MRKKNKFVLVSLLVSMALLASCGQENESSSDASSADPSVSDRGSSSNGDSTDSSSGASSNTNSSNGSAEGTSSSSPSSSSSSGTSSSPSSSSSSSEETSRKATITFGTEPVASSVSTVIDASRFSVDGIDVQDVSAEYCYSNAKGKAARFSSSKNAGYLELTFSSSLRIRSLKAYTFLYKDSEAASLTLSASSFSESKSVSGTAYAESNYLVFENIGETSFLRIEGKRSKRFYLAKIELEIASSSGNESNSSSSSASSSGGSSSSSSQFDENEKGYYDVELSAIQKYRLDNFEDYGILGTGNLPSIGSPKLLVVPVYFQGDSAPSSNQIDKIKNAFFGDSSDTGWESLSSYYKKSSYGKLTITGTVTSAFQYSLSASDFQTAFEKGENSSDYKDTNDIVTEAVSWAKTKGFLNQTFDTNSDGFYDGIDLIYFTDKTYNNNEDLWWAYTTGMGLEANKADPVANRYFWSPMSMIENGYYSPDIDTHTLIHETGHMLGLDDYYSYERSGNGYAEAPCGMADMMDCNVGDHDAYSKMLMGWCAPKVVNGTGSFSITLNSFTDTGEFLLIPSSEWNGTPYDEYMILQYYTPTGLNEQDSTGYEEFSSSAYGHGGTYVSSGLQAFHVDSRVFSYRATSTSYSNMKYSDDPTFLEKQLSDGSYLINGWIAASNTASYSLDVMNSDINSENLTYGSDNRLITILPASGTSAFLSSGFEKNFGAMSNLYTVSGNNSYTNAKLRNCYQNNGKFNNGDTFPYSFTVSNQTSSSITIRFTHI